MKYTFFVFIILLLSMGCNNDTTSSPSNQDIKQSSSTKNFSQLKFKIDLHSPTVGITDYTLISDNIMTDSLNAKEIIQAKVILPLAMQRHDPKLFDSTLTKDFIYRGEEAFFNRKEYIQDRVNAKWMISDARYENIVVQFLDGYGILTYRNKITEKDEFGKDQLYTWFWTDVWAKEDGKWKLKILQALN